MTPWHDCQISMSGCVLIHITDACCILLKSRFVKMTLLRSLRLHKCDCIVLTLKVVGRLYKRCTVSHPPRQPPPNFRAPHPLQRESWCWCSQTAALNVCSRAQRSLGRALRAERALPWRSDLCSFSEQRIEVSGDWRLPLIHEGDALSVSIYSTHLLKMKK